MQGEPDRVRPAVHAAGKAAYEMRALDYSGVVVGEAVVGESSAAAAVQITKEGHVYIGTKSRDTAGVCTRRQQQKQQQ